MSERYTQIFLHEAMVCKKLVAVLPQGSDEPRKKSCMLYRNTWTLPRGALAPPKKIKYAFPISGMDWSLIKTNHFRSQTEVSYRKALMWKKLKDPPGNYWAAHKGVLHWCHLMQHLCADHAVPRKQKQIGAWLHILTVLPHQEKSVDCGHRAQGFPMNTIAYQGMVWYMRV